MFSIFKNGIKNIYPDKQPIFISDLAKLIRNNPDAETINRIRQLRMNSDLNYKKLKQDLIYITPNCMVKKRSIGSSSDFDSNFISFSKYIYFDFDVSDAIEFKQQFVQKYKDILTLVCISSGAGGISVLIKVNIALTRENFNSIWKYIVYEVFKEELPLIDTKTKDIGRAMFISSDNDLFINYENELVINPDDLKRFEKVKNNEKGTQHCRSPRKNYNTVSCTFSYQLLPFEEIKKVNLSTPIKLSNSLIDYQPINFLEIRFPKEIPDGYKHKYFTSIIHRLLYLNPDLDPSYIYSFIYYTNKYRANPSMELRTLNRLFEFVYNQTQMEGYEFKNERIKNFHLNKDASLSKEEKISVINKCNGLVRSNRSIQKIVEAKTELISRNEKITQKKLAQITGLGIQTIKKYYRVDGIFDINTKIDEINYTYSSNSGSTVPYHSGLTFPNTDFDLFH